MWTVFVLFLLVCLFGGEGGGGAGLFIYLFIYLFLLLCHMGSDTPCSEDLFSFPEGGCCYARRLSWLNIVPT